MAQNTKIEWATHTQNFWEGCQSAGIGCDHCYAEARNARFAGGTAINWGPGAQRRRTSEANWRKPLTWNANHEAFFTERGHRQRVFCSSLSDVFDNAVDPQWRTDMMEVIAATPQLDWMLLTKRIGNAHRMLDEAVPGGWTAWPNVWLGSTIVNQEEADRDIPKLLTVPAAKRFLSMEPLLGSVEIWRYATPHCERHPGKLDQDGKCTVCEGRGIWLSDEPLTEAQKAPVRPGLDWVIVGGESGPYARPMHPDWARSLRDQCSAAGVPFLFKQWGEWCPESVYGTEKAAKTAQYLSYNGEIRPAAFGARNGATTIQRVGKHAAGRMLDGQIWDGIPC
jgi:protein gp37